MDKTATAKNAAAEAKAPVSIRIEGDELKAKLEAFARESPRAFNNPGQRDNEICLADVMVDAASIKVSAYRNAGLKMTRYGAEEDGKLRDGILWLPFLLMRESSLPLKTDLMRKKTKNLF
jgi:hypothetical protein